MPSNDLLVEEWTVRTSEFAFQDYSTILLLVGALNLGAMFAGLPQGLPRSR